jgi:phage shock protein PspC (stress-responsive transcriptional regulator)
MLKLESCTVHEMSGGLAKHLGIDPLLMRLVTAEVTVPLYILLWIFVREEPLEQV